MISNALPSNLDIEKYILGCLMIDKQKEIDKLYESDFYNNTCKTTFEAINTLFANKKNIDLLTVSDLLKKKIDNSLEVVTAMMNTVITSSNFNQQLDILKQYSLKRDIINKSVELQNLAYSSSDTSIELKNEAMAIMDLKVHKVEDANIGMNKVLEDVLLDIEKRYNAKNEEKLFTGFYDLDKILAGVHPEELTIIGARPGVGKTAFALQLMIQLAHKGNNCYLVSREMSKVQLGKRLLSNIAKVDGNKLRLCKNLTDADFENIAKGQTILSGLPITLDDTTSTVEEIRSKCRELHNNNKLDVLFVDYLQLCKSVRRFSSRREEVEHMSRQFKEISMEFGIPVICLSQLSRTSAQGNREPELHDLRESGSIEQDADNVLFLHQDEQPEPTPENQHSGEQIKILVAKQRNGGTGMIRLKYYKKTLRFYNLSYK